MDQQGNHDNQAPHSKRRFGPELLANLKLIHYMYPNPAEVVPVPDPSRMLQLRITPGEFFDRCLILEIKLKNVADRARRRTVVAAYFELAAQCVEPACSLYSALSDDDAALVNKALWRLREVHQQLWDVEDVLRACEAAGDFSQSAFVLPARSVYKLNDERCRLKNSIDAVFGLAGEVKYYTSEKRADDGTEFVVCDTDDQE